MVRHIGSLLVVLAILSGCGDAGLLLPGLTDEGDTVIQTVADGAVLTRDHPLEAALQLRPGQQEPDRVEVTFIGRTGSAVASRTVVATEIDRGRLPNLALDALEPGYYRVEFALYSAGRRTDTVRRKLFVVDGTYRIAGVSAYPPAFMPDSQGILRADLEIPDGADPYLRWSFGGRTVSEALLSAGGGELLLRSPESEGVYTVQLELFPLAPPAGGYEFAAQLVQQADLVVRETRMPGERSFGPAASYYVLMHFAGNLRDSGMRPRLLGPAASDARLVGDVAPAIVEELFGYLLADGGAVAFDEAIVPFRDDGIGPFSVSMRLVLTEPSGAGAAARAGERGRTDRLFALEAHNPSFSLQLELSGDDVLAAHLQVDGRTATLSAHVPGLRHRGPVELSLAVVPRSTGTDLAWFVDGALAAGDSTPLRLPLPRVAARTRDADGTSAAAAPGWRALQGRTVLGGERGFAGLIDEFGVFFRDEHDRPSANVAPFRLEQLRRHGEVLLLAEGFESGRLPDGFALEGGGEFAEGAAWLPPATTLTPPALELRPDGADGVTVEIVTHADSRGRLQVGLRSGSGTQPELLYEAPPRTVAGDDRRSAGTVGTPDGDSPRHAAAAPLVLHLRLRDGRLLTQSDRSPPLELPLAPGAHSLQLEITNGAAEGDLGIESVSAYRDPSGFFPVIDVP